MQPQEKNKFGRSDLEVSAFGFGTAPVGNIFEEIDEKTSDEMFQVAWDSGVRFYDTAPMYGHGLSEYVGVAVDPQPGLGEGATCLFSGSVMSIGLASHCTAVAGDARDASTGKRPRERRERAKRAEQAGQEQ